MSKTLNLICLFGLVACGQRSERGSMIYAANISGKALTFNASEFEWGLPDHRVIQFNACLKDHSREGAIQNQAIEILKSDRTVVDQEIAPKTDRDGCFSWTEDFAVESLKSPHYTKITRILKPQSTFQPIEVHLAINPWEGINGNETAVINADQFAQIKNETVNSSAPIEFLVDRVSYQIDFDYTQMQADGLKGQLILSFAPSIKLVGMTGREKALKLTKGLLRIKAQIWRQAEHGSATLIAETPSTQDAIRFRNQDFTSGRLPLIFKTNKLDAPGTYFLSLYAEPQNAPQGLAALQRNFRLGGSLDEAGSAKFDSAFLVPQQVQNINPLSVVESYRLDIVSGSIEEVSREKTEGQNEVTARIRFEAPIINPLLKTAVVNREFKISSLQDPQVEIFCDQKKLCKTDEDGILRWVDQLTYAPYEKIKPRGRTYKLRLVDAKTGESVAQDIEINPQTTNTQSKIVDPREAKNRADSTVPDQQPEFRIQKICLTKVLSREIAEVDNQMYLNLRNKFDVVMKPRILRFDDPAFGLQAPYQLPRVGDYLLTMVVYPSPNKTDQPITSHQQIFHYSGGPVVQFPFELLVSNAHQELQNAFVLAQLSFVDQKTKTALHTDFKTPVMAFDFSLNDPGTCQQFVDQGNFIDQQKSLVEYNNKDLNEDHQNYQAQLKKHSDDFDQLAEDRKNFEWINDAQRFEVRPLLVTDNGLKADGFLDVNQTQMENALSCLEKSSWAQNFQMPNCLKSWAPIYQSICSHFFEGVDQAKRYKSNTSHDVQFDPEIYSARQRFASLLQECTERPDRYFATYKQTYVYKHKGSTNQNSMSTSVPVTRNYNIGVFGGSDFMRESNFNIGAKAILLFPLNEIRKSLKLTKAQRIIANAPPLGMSYADATKNIIIAFEEEGFATPKLPVLARGYDRFEQIYEFETLNNESALTTNASFNVETFNMDIEVGSSRDCYQLSANTDFFIDALMLDNVGEILKDQSRYFCFPINSDDRVIPQSYRIFHYASTQPVQASVNTMEVTQSLILKGFGDYRAFLSVFQDHMSPYHLDYIPTPLSSFFSDIKKDQRSGRILGLAETAGILKSEPPVEPGTFMAVGDQRNYLERIRDWVFVRGDVKRTRVKDQNRRHLAP